MKKMLLCALIVLITSCKKQSRDTPVNANDGNLVPYETSEFRDETPEEIAYWTMENLATALRDDQLNVAYPDLDVKEDVMLFGEGTIERNVKILASGTDDEILVSYQNGKPFEMLYGNRGRWRTKHPIYIGLPLENLNEINKKPVKFAGFGWDYSGLVNFNDGAIDRDRYTIFLSPNYNDIQQEDAYEFMGNDFFDSNAADVEKLHLYVSSITYKF
jgi:hypothetical protein